MILGTGATSTSATPASEPSSSPTPVYKSKPVAHTHTRPRPTPHQQYHLQLELLQVWHTAPRQHSTEAFACNMASRRGPPGVGPSWCGHKETTTTTNPIQHLVLQTLHTTKALCINVYYTCCLFAAAPCLVDMCVQQRLAQLEHHEVVLTSCKPPDGNTSTYTRAL